MAWVMALGAALGAGSTIYGADKGADAAKDAAKMNNQLAIENRNIGLRMYEPSRALGYGATSDLATLYGYRLPEYTPLSALAGGGGAGTAGPAGTSNWAVGAPIAVKGKKGASEIAGIKVNPFASSSVRRGGVIDPLAGTVDVKAKKAKKQDKLSDAATAYLRGETDKLKGGKLKRIRRTIDGLHDQGYQWTPGTPEPTAGPIAGNHAMPTPGTSADGTAGNFSRFFTSPDYQWRLDQQNKAIERSAAASGGLFSGATGVALARESGNIASQEYGNYFERLMRIMGQGGAATNNAVNSVEGANSQLMTNNNLVAGARQSAYGQQSDAFNNLLYNLYGAYKQGG
jgi:hypothetical protein